MLMIRYLGHRGSRGGSGREEKTTARKVNEAKRLAVAAAAAAADGKTLRSSGKTLRRGGRNKGVRHTSGWVMVGGGAVLRCGGLEEGVP